jgi:hypothetical protein
VRAVARVLQPSRVDVQKVLADGWRGKCSGNKREAIGEKAATSKMKTSRPVHVVSSITSVGCLRVAPLPKYDGYRVLLIRPTNFSRSRSGNDLIAQNKNRTGREENERANVQSQHCATSNISKPTMLVSPAFKALAPPKFQDILEPLVSCNYSRPATR